MLPLLGEFVTRHIPDGTVVKHTQVLTALRGAGLPETLAGGLSLSEAMGRVVKTLAGGGLVHRVRKDGDTVRFQLDDKAFNAGTDRVEVHYRADVVLNRTTGAITSTDPIVESQARALIGAAQTNVKTTDISRVIVRVIVRVIAHECGRVYSKGNSSVQFFIPAPKLSAADKLEAFLTAIGCSLSRVPVVDVKAVEALLVAATPATPSHPATVVTPSSVVVAPASDCGIPAVVDAITDGLLNDIYDMDTLLARISKATRESTIAKECQRILEIEEEAKANRALIGEKVEIVIDAAAYARKVLRDTFAAKKAEPEVAPEPKCDEEVLSFDEAPRTMALSAVSARLPAMVPSCMVMP